MSAVTWGDGTCLGCGAAAPGRALRCFQCNKAHKQAKNADKWIKTRDSYTKAKRAESLERRVKIAGYFPTICEICSVPLTKPCFDHNHSTGDFRGWLCFRCNSAIGLLKDDPKVLLSAYKYLKTRGSANA